MNKTKSRGAISEEMAAHFLISCDFSILMNNVHSRYGEIDLIAWKKHRIYIFEVKSTLDTFRFNLETLTKAKFVKILKTLRTIKSVNIYSFGGIYYLEMLWSSYYKCVINQTYYEIKYEDWD